MIDTKELKQQKLLSDLNESELAAISKMIVSEKCVKGTLVLKDGDAARGIFLIRKGKVEISKITADGWKQTLAMLTENHFFGELSAVEEQQSHSADVTALDDSEFFLIRKSDLRQLETAEPAIMYKIMRSIARVASKNVRSMNEKLMKALISY